MVITHKERWEHESEEFHHEEALKRKMLAEGNQCYYCGKLGFSDDFKTHHDRDFCFDCYETLDREE